MQWRRPWYPAACAAACAILYLSLYPWRFDWSHSVRPVPWQDFTSRIDWLDSILNLFFYVPLGWAGTRAAAPGWRAVNGVAWAAFSGLFSLGIEVLQQFTGRSSSLRDVAFNTLGAALGAALAVLAPPMRGSSSAVRSWPAVTLLAFWCLWQGLPFVPYFRLGKVRQSLLPFNGLADTSLLLEYAMAGLVIPWLARTGIPRHPRAATALCAAFMLGRVFWGGQVLPAACVIGLAAGLAASLAIPRPPIWLLAAYLVHQQLAPFTFSAQASGFGWIPLEWLLTGDRASAARMLAAKLFWYGALVWRLSQSGMRWMASAAGVIAFLFATEWIQRWLPGRTPELTDPVLAAIAAALQRAQSGRNSRT